jgi:uncharacterized membrane protein
MTTGGQQQFAQVSLTYQSPLPPPEVLEKYDQILPGSTERFLRLAEGEALHRRGIERWLVRGGVIQSYLGLLCGFALGAFGLYVAWQLGIQGHTWEASIIAVLDITSLVSVFVLGVRAQRKAQQKAQAS